MSLWYNVSQEFNFSYFCFIKPLLTYIQKQVSNGMLMSECDKNAKLVYLPA